jgi:hypothetical protein
MQECETSTQQDFSVKRVSVRSGGAGHAHSGVVKANTPHNGNPQGTVTHKRARTPKATNGKIVKLGR